MTDIIKLLAEGDYQVIERKDKLVVVDPTGHIVFVTNKLKNAEAAVKRIKARWSKTKAVSD